jgi:hypothetical protein
MPNERSLTGCSLSFNCYNRTIALSSTRRACRNGRPAFSPDTSKLRCRPSLERATLICFPELRTATSCNPAYRNPREYQHPGVVQIFRPGEMDHHLSGKLRLYTRRTAHRISLPGWVTSASRVKLDRLRRGSSILNNPEFPVCCILHTFSKCFQRCLSKWDTGYRRKVSQN